MSRTKSSQTGETEEDHRHGGTAIRFGAQAGGSHRDKRPHPTKEPLRGPPPHMMGRRAHPHVGSDVRQLASTSPSSNNVASALLINNAIQSLGQVKTAVASISATLSYLQAAGTRSQGQQHPTSALPVKPARKRSGKASAKPTRPFTLSGLPQMGAARGHAEGAAMRADGRAHQRHSETLAERMAATRAPPGTVPSSSSSSSSRTLPGAHGAQESQECVRTASFALPARSQMSYSAPSDPPLGAVPGQAYPSDLVPIVAVLQSLQREGGARQMGSVAVLVRRHCPGLMTRMGAHRFSDFIVQAQIWLDLQIEIGNRRGQESLFFPQIDRPWLASHRQTPLPCFQEQVDQLFQRRDGDTGRGRPV